MRYGGVESAVLNPQNLRYSIGRRRNDLASSNPRRGWGGRHDG